MFKLRLVVSALALTCLPNAQAAYIGSLTFVQATGTVSSSEDIPVWLRLTLDPASDPLVLSGNSSDTPPFGVSPSNYPSSFFAFDSATNQDISISNGVLISVDNISLNTSFGCSGTFTDGGCPSTSTGAYNFNFNAGADSINSMSQIALNPGDSRDYLFGTFTPNGPVSAGNYEFYWSSLIIGFSGTVRAPKLDDNGDPILDQNGDPILQEFSNASGDYDIATTGCNNQNNQVCAAAFTRTVSAVPLPATFWLFGSAMLGVAGYARRRPI